MANREKPVGRLDQLRHVASEALAKAGDEAKAGARRTADVASRAAFVATDRAGAATAAGVERAGLALHRQAKETADQTVETLKDPETRVKARKAVVGAGKSVKSAIDKLNPELLASVVLKATSLQEQANASLRRQGSLYRISGISIGATFPPSISFQIGRLSDLARDFIELPEAPVEAGAAAIDDAPPTNGAG
ncbi:MAG TPA: hypothetical protein VKR30_06690 [Candidatus Limnocylindrales bacterium]|nr:hypothetical protein [Candidatus Limnocylindrales bacterium]